MEAGDGHINKLGFKIMNCSFRFFMPIFMVLFSGCAEGDSLGEKKNILTPSRCFLINAEALDSRELLAISYEFMSKTKLFADTTHPSAYRFVVDPENLENGVFSLWIGLGDLGARIAFYSEAKELPEELEKILLEYIEFLQDNDYKLRACDY